MIYEQNRSIAAGLLKVQVKLEGFQLLLPKDFEPLRVLDLMIMVFASF